MQSSAYKMIYQDALVDLMNGCLMPWDREILSGSPLPSTVIEPYMVKEVPDVRESMRMTYESMAVWIDEARKADYFSKHFVQLSRMIMNGVTTMGRGLITLHARGEDLDDVPMSIQDLIGVASYHFRKSHLGVLQTVRSHPEISERLLINQIGWNNMLMRLFKTRDKLNQVPGVRVHGSEAAGIQDAGNKDSASLTSGEKDLMLTDAKDEGFDPFKVFGPSDRGLSEPAAIREPGSFTAPRALSSYENKNKEIRTKKSTFENKKEEIRGKRSLDENKKEVIRSKKSPDEANNEEKMKKDEAIETRNKIPEIRNETADEKESGNKEEKNLLRASQTAEPTLTEENASQETCNRQTVAADSILNEEDTPQGTDNWQQATTASILTEENTSQETGNRQQATAFPAYQQILQNAFARSGPSEDGEVTFTFDEILYLAADPEFNHLYPDQAAQIHSILQQMNSS